MMMNQTLGYIIVAILSIMTLLMTFYINSMANMKKEFKDEIDELKKSIHDEIKDLRTELRKWTEQFIKLQTEHEQIKDRCTGHRRSSEGHGRRIEDGKE